MVIEALVALVAAWKARSLALAGFGGDSTVELLSAIVVLWRFRTDAASADRVERHASIAAGVLLFVLAAFILVAAVFSLLGFREPRPSIAGIALLILAAFGMPWLAAEKRKLAARTGSASLRADATESALCGYLSWIALAGLLANAAFHFPMADSLAAVALLPIVLREGWLAVHASRCACN